MRLRHLSKSLLAAALVTLTSCSSARFKTVAFRAITDSQMPLPCMIVVDDRWPEKEEQASFTTQDGGRIKIDYSGREQATVTLVPVEMDANGSLVVFPRAGESGAAWRCKENPRVIEYTDHSPVLFIFTPRFDQ